MPHEDAWFRHDSIKASNKEGYREAPLIAHNKMLFPVASSKFLNKALFRVVALKTPIDKGFRKEVQALALKV